MNWYRHPETVDQLAAAYVMGSMSPRVKRRFEQVMRQRTEVALAVEGWADLTLPLLDSLPAHEPSPAVWAQIAQRTQVGLAPASASAAALAPAAQGPWWRRWLAPVPAGAWAFGLVMGLALPLAVDVYRAEQQALSAGRQLPESYVGVLATPAGKPGLIVSSLRQGTVVDIKELSAVAVPAGQTLFLWRIDKAGVLAPLGPVPAPQAKFAQLHLPEPAEKAFFPAVELAVSIEAQGSRPTQPASAFVYRGLCGKLWK